MSIDQALQSLLVAFDNGDAFDVTAARCSLDAFAAAVGAGAPPAESDDLLVAGVPVRRYHPDSPAETARGPALVWLHGGGWVTGSLAAVDPLCRSLLFRTGAPVTSVAYRLAPEHPFPAALEDCVAVLRAEASKGPVVVGGDSAGGGLAAAACLAVRGEGLPVLAQVLVTPLLDATLSSESVTVLGSGFGLTRTALQRFVALYLEGADPRDPRCSPLLAGDLSGLPPAVVLTAECDPLRDEGEAYAARLGQAGVPVAARRFDAMVHGFAGMTALTPVADQALDWLIDELVRLTAR
ncbi:MAG: alpha/beta hydrolase [Frankiales bacterium]|nr:alpha/beta hydrolase [Frankiales bacterium]